MADKIKIRRDTAANWTSVNPVLDSGEFGLETDTRKIKIGDGATAWVSLGYVNKSTAENLKYVQDTVGTYVVGGTNVSVNYNAVTGYTTISANDTSVDWTEITNKPNVATTDTVQSFTGVKTFTAQPSGIQAVSIANTPAGNIASTDVQSAINELDTEKQPVITGAATTITGADLTISRALVSDASGKVAVSATTSTELGYVSGVTSAIQTQINGKQATITGAATTITSADLTASMALVSDANGKVSAHGTVSATELGYLDGVTSAIQTQIDGKQATITGAATTVTSSNLTASRAVVSDASGKIAISTVTDTELGYVSGVTSAIQTQLNAKAPLDSPALTGTPTAPTALSTDNSTTIATTAFVKSVVGTSSGVAIQASFKNLKIVASGLTNTSAVVTADEIALKDGSGNSRLVSSVNVTINSAASGANGLDTGTLAGSTWYSVWVINNGTTTAGLLSTSATAPTLPSGYTYYARVGWVRTDSTANKYLLQTLQKGRKAQYVVLASSNVPGIPAIITGTSGDPTVPTWTSASTANFVPSTAISASLFVLNYGASGVVIAHPSNQAGAASSGTNPARLMAQSGSGREEADIILESTNMYYASNMITSGLYCAGWTDDI